MKRARSGNGMTKVAKVGAQIGGLIKRKPFPYADRGVVVTPAGHP